MWLNASRAKPTSEDSELEVLLEYVEMASDCEGAGLDVGGLGDSAVSPFGRTPSANQTLLCSRVRDPKKVTNTQYFYLYVTLNVIGTQCKTVFLFPIKVVPSLPGCFKTPTGTMTVGGGELSTPEA